MHAANGVTRRRNSTHSCELHVAFPSSKRCPLFESQHYKSLGLVGRGSATTSVTVQYLSKTFKRNPVLEEQFRNTVDQVVQFLSFC